MRQLSKTFTALLVGLFCIFIFTSSFAQSLKPIARDTVIDCKLNPYIDTYKFQVNLSELVNNYDSSYSFYTLGSYTNQQSLDYYNHILTFYLEHGLYASYQNYKNNKDYQAIIWVVCNSSTSLCDTAIIRINPVNQPPVAQNDTFTIHNNLDWYNILDPVLNDYDPDGDLVKINKNYHRYSIWPLNEFNHLLAYWEEGKVEFKLRSNNFSNNFTGVDSMSYVLADRYGEKDTAMIFVNIINYSPVIKDSTFTIYNAEYGGFILDFIEDYNYNIDPKLITTLKEPLKGKFTIDGNDDFTYFRYIPDSSANLAYADTVIVKVCDNGTPSLCDTAIWIFNVRENLPPDVVPQYQNLEYNYTSLVNLSLKASDIDDGIDSFKIISVPSSFKIISWDSKGSIELLPVVPSIIDTLYFRAFDHKGHFTDGIVVITVSDNIAPIMYSETNGELKTVKNKFLTGQNLYFVDYNKNEFIPETDSIRTSKGGVVIAPIDYNPQFDTILPYQWGNSFHAYTFNYIPPKDFVGVDTFYIKICDFDGACDSFTYVVTVFDDQPTTLAVNDTINIQSDKSFIEGDAATNDFKVDYKNDKGYYSLVQQPKYGTLSMAENGSFIYNIINKQYIGSDTAYYKVCNEMNICDTAMILFRYIAIDTQINKTHFYYSFQNNIIPFRTETYPTITLRCLKDGSIYTLGANVSLILPKNGEISKQGSNEFIYTPNNGFRGLDTLIHYVYYDYSITNSCFESKNIRIDTFLYIFFNNRNLYVETSQNKPLIIPNLTKGTAKVTLLSLSHNGVFSIYNDTMIYAPATNFVGIDSVAYSICYGSIGLCDTIWLIVKVNETFIAYAPDAQNDYFEMNENTPISNTVAQNDTDRNNDLNINSFKVIKSVKNGVLAFKMTGDFTYTPAANFVGQDTASYSVCDSTGLCDTAMLIIKVNAVKIAYAPDAQNDYFETSENTPLSNTVIKNDSDRNNDLNKNSYAIVKAVKNGNLTLKSNGDFTYTPATNFIGQDTASYSVCDSTGLCDTANLYMTIKKIYHAPTLLEDVFFNTFNNTVRGSVALNDSDSDNDLNSASYQIAVNPKHGNVKIWNDGKFVYLPQYNFVGIDTFLYKACDNRNLCSQGICVIATRGGSLMGKIFVDENKNGLVDTSEVGIANIPVKINGNIMAVTNAKGDYYLPVDTNKTYIVEPIFLSSLFTLDPLSKEVKTGNTFNQVIDNQNFALSPQEPIRDLKIVIEQGEARPGFASNTVITYSNNGTSNLNGSIKLKLDYYLAFNQSDIEPSDIQGNNLTWDFTNLKPFESRRINIINKTSLNSTLGKQMSISYSSILKDAIDADTSNNTGVSLREIRGSYDPNDISVDVENVIQKGTIRESVIPLTYTIRFQNTGNAEAYRVEVVDTLSEKLDISSIEMISASHKFEMKIEPNAPQNQTIVRWIFDNINLMDSTTKEACSHGFVKYRINNDKSKTNYFKDSIPNKAAIYFDFNPPVITNTAYTNFLFSTPTSEIQSLGVHAYPNPTSGLIRIELDETISEGNLEVSTLYGQIIQREAFRGGLREIDMSNLAQGVYFIKITSGRKQGTIRIIKQ